jgi:hypothetical protein
MEIYWNTGEFDKYRDQAKNPSQPFVYVCSDHLAYREADFGVSIPSASHTVMILGTETTPMCITAGTMVSSRRLLTAATVILTVLYVRLPPTICVPKLTLIS